MNWLIVIIIVSVIGGIIGFFVSNDGERKEGAAAGCLTGGIGCGYIVVYIGLGLLSLYLLFKLGSWLFG